MPIYSKMGRMRKNFYFSQKNSHCFCLKKKSYGLEKNSYNLKKKSYRLKEKVLQFVKEVKRFEEKVIRSEKEILQFRHTKPIWSGKKVKWFCRPSTHRWAL